MYLPDAAITKWMRADNPMIEHSHCLISDTGETLYFPKCEVHKGSCVNLPKQLHLPCHVVRLLGNPKFEVNSYCARTVVGRELLGERCAPVVPVYPLSHKAMILATTCRSATKANLEIQGGKDNEFSWPEPVMFHLHNTAEDESRNIIRTILPNFTTAMDDQWSPEAVAYNKLSNVVEYGMGKILDVFIYQDFSSVYLLEIDSKHSSPGPLCIVLQTPNNIRAFASETGFRMGWPHDNETMSISASQMLNTTTCADATFHVPVLKLSGFEGVPPSSVGVIGYSG